MTSSRYFPNFAGHQCPPGAWWHQLQFWWAYIGGSRPQTVLLSMWHKVACRLCKREKAGGQGQCLEGRQKSLYIVQSVYLRGQKYFLGATGEKVCNPRQSITSHSRVVEFQEKTLVGNFIEGFEKSRSTASIYWPLSRSAARSCTVRISRTFFSESML